MTFRLEVNQVSVTYPGKPVVNGVSFALSQGQIGSLLGPSGCGKTTLLRAIAGFGEVIEGEVRLRGETVSRPGLSVPPEKRRVGMVFQDFTLFPHMTIVDNVVFGLRDWKASERERRVSQLLELTGLGEQRKKYPHQLSGGEQQRVALVRAMAPKPDVLLLDEPFSSMDAELRETLAVEVRDILKQEEMTAVLVTHDQIEAFAVADEIGVMHKGAIEQWSTAYDIYHRPATRFVADFIGLGVLVGGTVLDASRVQTELGVLSGRIDQPFAQDERVEILVRPDDILHNDESTLVAEVTERQFRGAEFLYKLRLPNGARLLCYAASHHDHKIGERIGIEIDIEHLVMFKHSVAEAAAGA